MNDSTLNWWKHGVIYHIFPLSFYDSDGDGFGDIQGIISKLDYVAFLGVDAIWLSPIYQSPLQDAGYDVADFMEIDSRFGTMEDFNELITEAHKRGIRVIMDLILNHTSDKHSWFVESSASDDNPKKDWYIWHKGRAGIRKKKPNNWRTALGQSAWTLHHVRNEYYYHSFFSFQPDLNWRNKEMREEYFNQIRFWLEKGIDGFRLDVINFIIKDKKFRNTPLLSIFPFLSSKSYTRNRARSYKIIRKLRKVVDEYPGKMLIGEIYSGPPGNPDIASSYLGRDQDLLHLAFDFSIVFRRWNARHYYNCIERWMKAIPEGGWPCHVFSNHDVLRYINRPGFGKRRYEKARIVATLLLTLKGTPVMYYGDEIGMKNARIKYSDIVDPAGKKYWPFFKGRDRSRTPMQWNAHQWAGFSNTSPWLPVDPSYVSYNVESSAKDTGSLLSFYRRLLSIRKEFPVLQSGGWEPVFRGENGVIAFTRTDMFQIVMVVLNFTGRNKTVQFRQYDSMQVVLSTHRQAGITEYLRLLSLSAYEASLFQVKITSRERLRSGMPDCLL